VRVRLTSASQFDAYRTAVEADKTFSVKAMRERDYYQKQVERHLLHATRSHRVSGSTHPRTARP
jgi:hypothetical protein